MGKVIDREKPEKTIDRVNSCLTGKAVFFVCLFVLIGTVIFYYPALAEDYDLWWQLRYGEHYVNQRTWNIDITAYSWTPTYQKDKYVAWLGSSLLYIIYTWTGVTGLLAFKWFTFFLVFLLFYIFIRMLEEKPGMSHLMAFALIAVAMKINGAFIKPERISDVFFVATLFIYFASKLKGLKLFYIYPLMFLIWVNTHGAFINGLVFITIALIVDGIQYLLKSDREEKGISLTFIKGFAISVLFSYAATLINPSGIAYHFSLFNEYTSSNSAAALATERLIAWESMWKYLFPAAGPINFMFLATAWAIVIMAALFTARLISSLRRNEPIDYTLVIVNILFFLLSMKISRATLYYPPLWFFSYFYIQKKNIPCTTSHTILTTILFFISTAFMFISTLLVLYHTHWIGSFDREFVPYKTVKFIKQLKPEGPIFNDYLTGGYLMWALYPQYKVFIDPRQAPYMAQVLPDYFELNDIATEEILQKFMKKYPIRTAIIDKGSIKLLTVFLKSPSWKLIYFDECACVLVRSDDLVLLLPRMAQCEMRPLRFKNLKNPLMLRQLFLVYLLIDPAQAREISEIYKKNVSPFFYYKKSEVEFMEKTLKAPSK